MLATLQIVIGIVFVMLLISLLASVILEYVAGRFALRGRHLANAIKIMLGEKLQSEFVRHPYFQQLATGSTQKVKIANEKTVFPSYIDANSFSSILVDTLKLDAPEGVQERIQQMPAGTSQQMMIFLYNQSDSVHQLQGRIEAWYEQVMSRASGAYKRETQRWLFFLGLILAIVLNADTLVIYHNLSVNASLRDALNMTANYYIAQNNVSPSLNTLTAAPAAASETMQRFNSLVNSNITAFEAPLGVGWSTFEPAGIDELGWFYKLGGWLITAFAVSFGATFWFELLKKIMNVRSSGPAPASPSVPAPRNSAPPSDAPAPVVYPSNTSTAAGFAPPRPDGVLLRPEEEFNLLSRSAQRPPSEREVPIPTGDFSTKMPRNYQQ
jgi:hypothetical protein